MDKFLFDTFNFRETIEVSSCLLIYINLGTEEDVFMYRVMFVNYTSLRLPCNRMVILFLREVEINSIKIVKFLKQIFNIRVTCI